MCSAAARRGGGGGGGGGVVVKQLKSIKYRLTRGGAVSRT